MDLTPPSDESGAVISNDKGLSVSADWRTLQGHLIPDHLDNGLNDASGKNMAVYVHGSDTGPFAVGIVSRGLEMILKMGTEKAGVIRPIATVPLAISGRFDGNAPELVERRKLK